MKIIGITGPTGAGKTTALNTLVELGGLVLDCDAIYHRLLEESRPLRNALAARFGDVLEGGDIDRKKLGNVVFGDPAALMDLNTITHSFVGGEVDRLLREAQAEHRRLAAVDAIALIESGLGARCDAVVGILAPAEVRIRRIMAREGISEAYARKRAEAQKDEGFFRANCTHILENGADDTAETFEVRARLLFVSILGTTGG